MRPIRKSEHLGNILNNAQTLKNNSENILSGVIEHARNFVGSDAELSKKIAQEVDFITSLDSVTIKDNARKIGEPISNIVTQITTAIEESDNPIIQSTMPYIKQHTKNPEEIFNTDLKNSVERTIDEVFEQSSEIQNEVIKTVVKSEIKKKFFKNPIMNKLYEYYLKIKNFIIRNTTKEK